MRSAAAALVLVALLLSGCSAPEPTSIEVYVEPAQPDGVRESAGTCRGEAGYEAHVQALSGSVEVTVVDGDGAARRFAYTASGADKATVEGASGTWTLRVAWTGFRGSVHAGLLC